MIDETIQIPMCHCVLCVCCFLCVLLDFMTAMYESI